MISVPLTRALIVINAFIFTLMAFAGAHTIGDLVHWGANYGPLTTSGDWWRLFTSMFIHIGFVHLFFNMFALWNLGVTIETVMGGFGFLVVYMLSGLAGSIMSLMWHPGVVSAGASGAIFGLFGALIGLLVRRFLRTGIPIDRSVVRSLLVNVLINLGISLLPGIDLAAHAGGMLAGFALGLLIDPEPRRERWWQHPLIIALYGMTFLAVAFAFVPKVLPD